MAVGVVLFEISVGVGSVSKSKFDIYTGYYAQMKKYWKLGIVPVSIAYLTPQWYDGEVCFELAPSRQLLKKWKQDEITEDEYKEQYIHQLDNDVQWSKVLKKLKQISAKYKDADLVLCCYEKPEDFCHRHILAEYFRTEMDMDVIECEVPK